MNEVKLKPCPFCGGEVEHEVFNDGFFTLGRVECKQCRVMLTALPINAIEAWNTRADGWIPCSERLPEIDEEVLVTNGGVMCVRSLTNTIDEELVWDDEYGQWEDFEEFIAWMPLPEPYKGV